MQYYDKTIVGNRMKQIRKQKNMTQSKLAEFLDYINGRQLQRIENGETGCTVDKLMRLLQMQSSPHINHPHKLLKASPISMFKQIDCAFISFGQLACPQFTQA